MAAQFQLTDDEALVLFDLLSSGKLAPIADTAEILALAVIQAQLEKQLVAPFAPNYTEQITIAKSSLVACYGESLHDNGAVA